IVAGSPNDGPERSRITYIKGNLFVYPKTSLSHCIIEDGIAILFKKKFGGSQHELLSQQKKPGEVAVLKGDGRHIYYLITKKRALHKPTYENLQKSLQVMKSHCLENAVKDISMPRNVVDQKCLTSWKTGTRIECGLDRLQWENVPTMTEEVFEATDIKITAYTLGTDECSGCVQVLLCHPAGPYE
ncbi:LOW QUALITY PROTEIN: ADP-ribose glycohydrolase OARD1-like, partial [Dugong dugon]